MRLQASIQLISTVYNNLIIYEKSLLPVFGSLTINLIFYYLQRRLHLPHLNDEIYL